MLRWSRGFGSPFAWLLRGPRESVWAEVRRRGGVPGCRPCPVTGGRSLRFWAVLLLACAALDVAFTWLAFRLGAVEANPVMAVLFRRLGFAGGCLLKAVFVLSAAAVLPAAAGRSRLAGAGLVFCAAFQALVAVWGLFVVILLC